MSLNILMGANLKKMAISLAENALRFHYFFRSFHFIFSKKWTAGGDASENGDFQRRKQRLQGPHFLMIMMMMISCWCCDDDASLSSISFLKSLIAQQPFCKMILTKLFFFWDRRINVILFFFRATGWKRKSEKTKNVWPKNAQSKMLWEPACLNASQGPFVTGVPLSRKW